MADPKGISLEEFMGGAPQAPRQQKSEGMSLEEFMSGAASRPVAEPTPEERPGLLQTLGEAGQQGFVSGLKETIQGLPGQEWKYTPETKKPTYVETLLVKPISEGWRDPNWWAANMMYGLTQSSPTLGATVVGGGLGAITPVPGGMISGAALGAGIGSYIQTVAPAYQKARAEGLDHEAAVDRAITESGIASVFGAGMAGAPFLKIARGPISQALTQIFGVQPGLSVAQQAVTQIATDKEIDPEELLKTYAVGTAIGVGQLGAGRLVKGIEGRLRPQEPDLPPPTKPPSPNVQAGEQLGLIYAKAQKDMTPADLTFLDYARRGGYGREIQERAETFFAEQNQKVLEAATRIEKDLGRGAEGAPAREVGAIPRDEVFAVAERLRSEAERAQEIARQVETRAREFPEAGAEQIAERIRGGEPEVSTRIEAGEIVGPALRENYEARRAAEREAYRRAEEQGGGFYLDAINNLGTRIRERLSEPTLESAGMLLTERDAPLANQALNYLDQIGALRMRNIADPRNVVSGGDAQPVIFNLTGIEGVRRELNRLYGDAQAKYNRTGDQTDFAAVRSVRRAFEQHLDDSFVNGMFSGNPEAIAAWTEARGMARDRKQLFLRSAEHPEGKIIREIVDRQPDPQAVGNMLMGTSRMGRGEMSVLLARRLGEILGPDSPSMSAIRQAAWNETSLGANVRRVDGTLDPLKMARNVLEFVGRDDRNATDLARELYTPEVRQAMRAYAEAVRGLDETIARLPEIERAQAVEARRAAMLEPDIGGRAETVFRRMVDGTAQPEEIGNLIATHYAHAPSPNLARMISHVKTLVGPNSESMAAVRQLLFKQLVMNPDGTIKTPVMIDKALGEFLDGKGSSVARAAMSPQDMIQLRQFRAGIKPYILPESAKTGSPTDIRASARRFEEGDIETRRRVESMSRFLAHAVVGRIPGGKLVAAPVANVIAKSAGSYKQSKSQKRLQDEYMTRLREQIEEGFQREPLPEVYRAPASGLATDKEDDRPQRATGGSVLAKMANGGRPPLSTWTANDPLWRALTPYQKAAAMALMEADKRDPESAKNALGAMINRAARSKQDLGMHVSRPIYQPAIEATQQARLPSILKSPAFQQLTGWAERRAQGYEPDPVAGATHFITKDPRTMLKLEASDPKKYRSWRNWTKYTDERGDYQNVLKRDPSHAFLAPEGVYSVPYRGQGATQPVSAPSDQDRAKLDALIADAEKRAGMDRLASDAAQPQNVQSLASSPEDRQALDRLFGSIIGPSEADKSQLNRYIQGLMTPEPQAPMPALQPVQLGAPTPIAPVTPYDARRARGGRAKGGVLRRFKKSGATA